MPLFFLEILQQHRADRSRTNYCVVSWRHIRRILAPCIQCLCPTRVYRDMLLRIQGGSDLRHILSL